MDQRWLVKINSKLLCPLANECLSLVPRKVQEGEEAVRAKVCTEAMDFMEGMRDGWNGLVPPVAPDLVSFNIIIKVGPRIVCARMCKKYVNCSQQAELAN